MSTHKQARHYKVDDKPKKQKKKRSNKGKILLILQIFFIAVFVVSAFMIVYNQVILPRQVDSSLTSIQDELFSELGVVSDDTINTEDIDNTAADENTGEEEREKSSGIKDRTNITEALTKLKTKYNDLIGWIEIDNTVVNFPVMQSSNADPDYYLRRDHNGNYSKYGCIYLDSDCNVDGDVQILYGHSMSDKRMFYCLIDMADPEVLKDSPVIKYDTYGESSDWKVVSVFKANLRYSHGVPFNYLKCNFKTNEEKMQFIYECMIRSTVDTGVDICDTDEFLLLSTCSYEFEDFRTVVVARRVRDNESSEMDVSLIKNAENTLYPDVWYESYGGSKPNYPETFKEALEKGIINWYTGDLD